MEKTLTIGGKTVKFKTNGLALLTYKREIGRDLIPDLFSIYGGRKEIEAVQKEGKVYAEKLNAEVIYDVAYVFAKIADNSVGSRDEWLRGFDTFPIADVALEIVPMVTECITSDATVKKQMAAARLRLTAMRSEQKKSFWRHHKQA